MIIHIFVSSTWLDLQPERKAVENAIHMLRETKFIGMEYFGSRDETTQRASLDEVDRSQVYVGIFGGRYGSGITEEEYRRARALKLPCFIYFKDQNAINRDEAALPALGRELDSAKAAKLVQLKEDLQQVHSISIFKNSDELATKVTTDLHRWLFERYLPPMLEQAANGELSRPQAQSLVDAIRDWNPVPPDLIKRFREARFVVASGADSVAIAGNISGDVISGGISVMGDGNVIGNNNTVNITKTMTQGLTPQDLPDLIVQLRELVRISGLNEDDRETVETNLSTVEKEVGKAKPRLTLIESSLKSIESLVKSTEGIGSTATNLLPLLTQAIESARKLFA